MKTIEELKESALSIKEFGIGFIQVKVSREVVYNFYTDKVPRFENDESPHNHQRDFVSEIIHGRIEETRYEVWENRESGLTPFCGCGDTEKVITEKYDYEIVDNEIYMKGDIYCVDKEDFHSVEADNNTITKVTKLNYDDRHDAIILAEKVDHVESGMSEEQLWEIVKEIMNNV